MQFVVSKQNLQKELGFVQGVVEKKKYNSGSLEYPHRVSW